MFRLRKLLSLPMASAFVIPLAFCGCVNVKAPETINVGSSRRSVDASRVPPTRDHAEARQKLAEAYDEIRHLQDDVKDLKEDKASYKRKLKECKRELEELEDRYDD